MKEVPESIKLTRFPCDRLGGPQITSRVSLFLLSFFFIYFYIQRADPDTHPFITVEEGKIKHSSNPAPLALSVRLLL